MKHLLLALLLTSTPALAQQTKEPASAGSPAAFVGVMAAVIVLLVARKKQQRNQ
ncbi:MAG: hypothetical protein ACRYFX_24120 [Janthinobacterium lividum]